MGGVYNAVLTSVVQWFPGKAGSVSGLCLMCYGCAPLLLGSVFNGAIERFGWRDLFFVLAICELVLLLLCSSAARGPSSAEQTALEIGRVVKANENIPSLTAGQMLRCPSFYLFFIWCFCMAACGMAISSHASPMAQTFSLSAGTAAMFAGLQSGGSGLGRVLFGAVYDRAGRHTIPLAALTAVCGGVLLLLAFRTGAAALLAVSFFVLGTAFGSAPVTSASFVKSTFGPESYGINLSVMNLSVLAASFAGPYIAGIVYESRGYSVVALLVLGYALLATVLSACIIRRDDLI